MNIRDFIWSSKEKKIAKAAFDKAYQNELVKIKNELSERIQNLDDLQDIWSIDNYLNQRRKEIDEKYDYRYSVLVMVFAKLLNEGLIQ